MDVVDAARRRIRQPTGAVYAPWPLKKSAAEDRGRRSIPSPLGKRGGSESAVKFRVVGRYSSPSDARHTRASDWLFG